MSLIEHPEWPTIRQHLYIEPYIREGGGSENPRFRIQCKSSMPAHLRDITVPCVANSEHTIRPLRGWETWGGARPYVGVTCPLKERIGCSRNKQATMEYQRIKLDLEAA